MAKIVVDTPTKEGLGFKDYAEALVNIILESESPFTIGILGEWGVGKTSLMQTMFEKLEAKRNGVIPVWFNAWRCERERNLAIIPLLEALMGEIKDKHLKEAFINIIKSIKLKCSLIEFEPGKVGLQNQVEEDLYYDNLKAIETTLEKTEKKIVVFIDDLDRCAPDKILEVLESTKVFLDIKGIVYVLGLNYDVVVKAIDQKYEALGVNGRDYLEKILQIPFRIPDWDVSERGKCIEDLIKKGEIDSAYKETFKTYKDIIKEVIEKTPRQVKQFINTYICEQEVFKDKNLDQTTHLILTILKFKWYDFYQNLFNEGYRKKLKEILSDELSDEKKLREELELKKDLIKFIKGERDTINKIVEMEDEKLSEYRRAGMIISQKIIDPVIINISKLKDENPDVRWRAAMDLESIGDARAIEPLISVLAERVDYVRNSAEFALEKIGADAVKPLIEALSLKDKTPTLVRSSAARLLGRIVRHLHLDSDEKVLIGADELSEIKDDVVKALEEASEKDPNQYVRSNAKEALNNIKAK
jgi:predicted KAP-like P-loop ATPase